MKPLRYLLIATHVPPGGEGGGMVRYATELARHLALRDEVELHVAVAAGAHNAFMDIVVPDHVWTVQGRTAPARSVRETIGALGGARLGTFHVVHGTKHLLPSRGWSWGRRPLLVLTVHDLLVFERPRDYGWSKRWLLRAPYGRSLSRADVILTDSDATRERLRARDAQLAEKAVSVPLAVSSALVGCSPEPVEIPEGKRFVLVVGDASPRKNLPVVMAAWRRVVEDMPDALLVHVGPSGWGTSTYGADYHDLVAQGSALSLGHVSDAKLRWLYEHAAACLCPSLAEGYGLPAAEAAYFGTPIIRSADAALREAAGGLGTEVDATDVAGWAAAISRALAEGSPDEAARRPAVFMGGRTWHDVAEESIGAARSALAKRKDRA